MCFRKRLHWTSCRRRSKSSQEASVGRSNYSMLGQHASEQPACTNVAACHKSVTSNACPRDIRRHMMQAPGQERRKQDPMDIIKRQASQLHIDCT